MNNQIKEEGLTDAYLLGKYDGYNKGRADAIDEVKRQMISLHTDMIFQYGADIVEARCDAFDELKEWLKEQKGD